MASCNAYYCYLFRNLLGNSKYSSTEEAYNAWYDYVTSFGFGVKLDTDFPSEKSGFVPTAKTYNKIYEVFIPTKYASDIKKMEFKGYITTPDDKDRAKLLEKAHNQMMEICGNDEMKYACFLTPCMTIY